MGTTQRAAPAGSGHGQGQPALSEEGSGGGYLRLSTDRETKGPGSWNEGGYLQLSMLETARAASKAREMADTTGEAAVPTAVPALETAAETTPEPQGRSSSGFPKGVTRIKKKGKPTGKYQARVYDSLETKEQRGLGSFATPELAGAAVEAAEAQLKEGISPWPAPKRINTFKRGEKPPPKKRVASVVVSECKLPKTVSQQKMTTIPIPASLDEIKDDGMRAFFDERSGEEI